MPENFQAGGGGYIYQSPTYILSSLRDLHWALSLSEEACQSKDVHRKISCAKYVFTAFVYFLKDMTRPYKRSTILIFPLIAVCTTFLCICRLTLARSAFPCFRVHFLIKCCLNIESHLLMPAIGI